MKQPVVLLPGMMCDARLFAPQIAAMSALHPVTVMPLVGHAQVSELAYNVLQAAPTAFALMGLSMGGIVAMEIIRQAPQRVTRLALFDTNHLSDTPERANLRNKEIQRVHNGELKAVIRDDMKPNYLAPNENKQAILDLCMSMAQALGPQVFIQQSRALQTRSDQTATLAKINVPTLIACGESDTLCPIERHQFMHELVPNSELQIIKGAGHLPTLEQPAVTTNIFHKWLSL